MSDDPIRFFDPRPPVGVVRRPDDVIRYPDPLPTDAVQAELLDAELRASGEIRMRLAYRDGSGRVDVVLSDVGEGVDGCLALTLESGERLVFAATDRERASAVILKLSTGHF
jgi:hypothetical protein